MPNHQDEQSSTESMIAQTDKDKEGKAGNIKSFLKMLYDLVVFFLFNYILVLYFKNNYAQIILKVLTHICIIKIMFYY